MKHVLIFILAIFAALPAMAQQGTRLQAFQTGDDSRGWEAVGRLDTGVSFCTATLIAPDLVLTAAHCLFHPVGGTAIALRDLTFRAGLRNGRPDAIRGVRQAHVLPDYSAAQGAELAMVARDLALLELDLPIGAARIAAIPARGLAQLHNEVTVISYGEGRAERPSLEEGCRILERQGAVRSLSCRVDHGSSGAPVMRITGQGPQVVAVMSASGRDAMGNPRSLAVAIDGPLQALMEQRAAAGAGQTGGLMRPGDGGRGRLGAHFIRP